ncbi:hypothetical protein BU17DRAFT_58148, partial [Hysterangium stoloniferum]
LTESKLSKYFWADSMITAAYVMGQSPVSALGDYTPYETCFNRRVDAAFFQPFRCPASAYILKDQHGGKFQSHTRKCIMLGKQ